MSERCQETNREALRTTDEAMKFDYLVALLPLFQVFPDAQRVILFGSRARGDHQERSDIDLAVYAPDMDIVTWNNLCLSITDNSKTLLPIDLIWLQQASAGLAKRIQREGVVVFEREDKAIR